MAKWFKITKNGKVKEGSTNTTNTVDSTLDALFAEHDKRFNKPTTTTPKNSNE